MLRDNQAWLNDLRAQTTIRDEALEDLRTVLGRVLPKTLSQWLTPDSGQFEAFLEDVIQETCLRVLNRLDTFEGRSQFTTWVYKIALRIALNELRHRKWQEVSLDGLIQDAEAKDVPLEHLKDENPRPELIIEKNDAIQLVQTILDEELTPNQRAAMLAIGVQGAPLEEVALRMGTNRNALYKMMHDARLRLKRRLKREGFEPNELIALFGN
jgi:RNA polymerase sigma-70 factor, ECF subfamily